MTKVLLTGATGFIGRHCLEVLVERGLVVHATSARRDAAPSANASWHQVDLLKPKQVKALVESVKPEWLLHMAWYTEPGDYQNSERNYEWLQASLSLLHDFHAAGGKRAVIAGSCAEYDWRHGRCDERQTPLAPSTTYGICKSMLREKAEVFAERTGMSLGWGRIFFLYGPHEHPARFVPSVVRSLLRGDPTRTTRGEQRRDFLFVRDVAAALVELLDSPVTGAVNVASGEAIALKDVVCGIARQIGGQQRVELGALPDRKDDPALLVANVDRLTTEVGFLPRYTLETGMMETIEWWKTKTF